MPGYAELRGVLYGVALGLLMGCGAQPEAVKARLGARDWPGAFAAWQQLESNARDALADQLLTRIVAAARPQVGLRLLSLSAIETWLGVTTARFDGAGRHLAEGHLHLRSPVGLEITAFVTRVYGVDGTLRWNSFSRTTAQAARWLAGQRQLTPHRCHAHLLPAEQRAQSADEWAPGRALPGALICVPIAPASAMPPELRRAALRLRAWTQVRPRTRGPLVRFRWLWFRDPPSPPAPAFKVHVSVSNGGRPYVSRDWRVPLPPGTTLAEALQRLAGGLDLASARR